IVPACAAVRSLYSLTKAMMLMPCWPSAGPTGGAGVALPAVMASFTTARTFLATIYPPLPHPLLAGNGPAPRPPGGFGCLTVLALDLQEVELDGRLAAEHRDQHPDLTLLHVDLVD